MTTKMNYNKSEIFKRAWQLYRTKENNLMTFGECLTLSWHIAKNGENMVSFEQIYKRFKDKILFYIKGRVNNHVIAEEILQDVFIKVNEHLQKYDVHKAKLNTWIYNIAKNRIVDYFRSKSHNKGLNTNQIESYVSSDGDEYFQINSGSTANELIENNELKTAISEAIFNLKPKYQAIAEMFLVDELSYDEIAENLNMPLGSVKGNINRVRTMLQAELKEIYAQYL